MSKLKTGPWSKKEENIVKKYAFKITDKELASKLNRAYGGVVWKKQQLFKNQKQDFVLTPITNKNIKKPNLWESLKGFFN